MNDRTVKNYHFIVTEEFDLTRLDVYLAKINEEFSRSFYQKLIKTNKVLLNEQIAKASSRVHEGDEVDIDVPPPGKWYLEPQKMDLDIIYEDSSVLVVNKPAGLVVHPGAGVWEGTLVHGLLAHCGELSSIGGIIRPGIVHRLDKNTSGLMVVAKNDRAHQFLQTQFQDRSLSRRYLALVWGHFPEEEGMIEGSIGRSATDRKKMTVQESGKEAITFYTVLNSFKFCSLLDVKLATGRTHQIRVHMKHSHHPIVGDPEYNGRESQVKGLSTADKKLAQAILDELSYQFLHASHLEFIHPDTEQKVTFYAELPENMQKILNRIELER